MSEPTAIRVGVIRVLTTDDGELLSAHGNVPIVDTVLAAGAAVMRSF
jgi:hypothetical protein